MKFTVLQENLSKGLQLVSKAVNVRSPLPVLSNVLMKTEKGRLRLTASNLHITITTWIGAKIDESGEITVPAKILMDFVSQITDEKIEGELNGATLNVKTLKAQAQFAGIPASEFPEIAEAEGGNEVILDAEEFSDALQKIQFVVATDEGRPVLTGVYMKIEGNTLVLAGTDGFRMSEYTMKLKKKAKTAECVLPAKSLADIIKAFSVASDTISLEINTERNIAVVKVEDMEAHVRMIEGEYPDYAAVVPDDFGTEVHMAREEFASGIKLANIFARDMGNMVKLVVNEDKIEALSQPTEAGSNSTEMKGELKGDDIEIAFNARYLLDFFNAVTDDEITFKATEPTKPGLFVITGKDNYFYLVMPMKANW